MVNQTYENTIKRKKEIKGFYAHLITYLCVSVGLFILNLIISPGEWWFYWLLPGWGIGLYFHGMGVFYFR